MKNGQTGYAVNETAKVMYFRIMGNDICHVFLIFRSIMFVRYRNGMDREQALNSSCDFRAHDKFPEYNVRRFLLAHYPATRCHVPRRQDGPASTCAGQNGSGARAKAWNERSGVPPP